VAQKTTSIREVMTPTPSSIDSDLSVNLAHQRMRNLGVRHLLVRRGAEVIGVVTDNELLAAIAAQGENRSFSVADVSVQELYTVSPNTLLSEVADQMAEHRYGCALVQDDDGEPLGIFTTVDACRLLSTYLKQSR
jgi:acetoin utilization protein AcuB